VAGRFPLYTDADIHGPVVDALIKAGWDVVRAVDRFPEGTDDRIHFEEAVRQGRVLVANDAHMKATAERWLDQGRSFHGLIWWPRKNYERMTVSDIVGVFDGLAGLAQPFGGYPIIHVKAPR